MWLPRSHPVIRFYVHLLTGGTSFDNLNTNHKFPKPQVLCMYPTPLFTFRSITEKLALDSHVPFARAYNLQDIFP